MKLQTEHLRLTATDGQLQTQYYTGHDATDGTLKTATDGQLQTQCYTGHDATDGTLKMDSYRFNATHRA